MTEHERLAGCHLEEGVECVGSDQLVLGRGREGGERLFRFDHVFSPSSSQVRAREAMLVRVTGSFASQVTEEVGSVIGNKSIAEKHYIK